MITEKYREAAKAAFMNEKTFASTLFAILVDAFGSMEFVNWDPEVVQAEIRDDLGVGFRDISPENQDKLMMMIGVYGTDLFFSSCEWFLHACDAFSNSSVLPAVFDPPSLEEIAWAVMEVSMQNVEDRPMETAFNAEIKAYVAQQASREGFSKLPGILDWADEPKRADDAALDPAALGAEMYAASYQADQDRTAKAEEAIRIKTAELGRELAGFPFMGRQNG
jgi:hypothetical protein